MLFRQDSVEEQATMPLHRGLGRCISLYEQTHYAHQEEEIKGASRVHLMHRRATSYCPAYTNDVGLDDDFIEMAQCLFGRTINLTGKDRRQILAKQAFIKYQMMETSSTRDSLKQ